MGCYNLFCLEQNTRKQEKKAISWKYIYIYIYIYIKVLKKLQKKKKNQAYHNQIHYTYMIQQNKKKTSVTKCYNLSKRVVHCNIFVKI